MAKPTLKQQAAWAQKAQSALAKSSSRTPSRVLKTFFPADIEICGHKVSKCGLGILGLLEKIQHPFAFALMGGEDRPVTIADQQRAFFIFANPRDARDLLSLDGDAFEAAVFEFCADLDAGALPEITTKITQLIRDALSTIPGVDLGAQKGDGSAPLEKTSPASPSATPA